jgi:hypothetical protein
VCFNVHKTTAELERMILTTIYLVGAKNTESWRARKGDIQRAFPLDVLMVHCLALAISDDGECLMCGGFSLSKTVHFGSPEFIADYFGSLILSPMSNDSGAAFIGSTHSVSPSSLQAMIEDSTEEFYMTSSGEGAPTSPFLEARYGGSVCSSHNDTMAGGRFGHSGHNDGSTTGASMPTPSTRQCNGEASSPTRKQPPRSGRMSQRSTSPCMRWRGS